MIYRTQSTGQPRNIILGKAAPGCMCGYGNTIQMADGSLLTPYSYTNMTEAPAYDPDKAPYLPTRLGIVHWRLPNKADDSDRSDLGQPHVQRVVQVRTNEMSLPSTQVPCSSGSTQLCGVR